MPTTSKAVALEIDHPSPNPPPRHGQDSQPQRKEQQPYFTYLTATACLVVFAWEMYLNDWTFASQQSNPLYGPSQATLLRAGAKRTDLIVEKGEWWRLFVPVYLHGGIIHLVVNMFGLLQLGRNLESFYGSFRIAPLYIFSGVVGNVVSALFLPSSITVGASGAIFGLLGASWADLIQNWNTTQRPCCQMIALLFTTALNVVMGLMPFLDNFCHLGGMFAGFFLGLVLLVNEDNRGRRSGHQIFCGQIGMVLSCISTLVFVGLLYTGVQGDSFCPGCHSLNCVSVPNMWSCETAMSCNVADSRGFELMLPGGGASSIVGTTFNTTGLVTCSDMELANGGVNGASSGQNQVNVNVEIVTCPEQALVSDALCLFQTKSDDGNPTCFRCSGVLSKEEVDVGFACPCEVAACMICNPKEVP